MAIIDRNAPSRRWSFPSASSVGVAVLFAGSVLIAANANARSEEVERAPSGVSYVSGVVITDARGAPLLDAYSEGPLLLAKLPPGTYRVNADFEGQPKDRTVTVTTSRLATLGFTWASN